MGGYGKHNFEAVAVSNFFYVTIPSSFTNRWLQATQRRTCFVESISIGVRPNMHIPKPEIRVRLITSIDSKFRVHQPEPAPLSALRNSRMRHTYFGSNVWSRRKLWNARSCNLHMPADLHRKLGHGSSGSLRLESVSPPQAVLPTCYFIDTLKQGLSTVSSQISFSQERLSAFSLQIAFK